MLSPSLRRIVLLFLAVAPAVLLAGSASADAKSVIATLTARLQSAEADLEATRLRVEAERVACFETLSQARDRAAWKAEDVETAISFRESARAELERTPVQTESAKDDARRIVRRLAGEGLGLGPDASAGATAKYWDQIRHQLSERLDAHDRALELGTHTETVFDREGRAVEVPVFHWGAVQRVAPGDDAATRGLCRRLDGGEWQVSGPLIETAPSSGAMPFDPTGRLAGTTPSETGLLSLLDRAGPFAWPILLVAFLGLAIVVDRTRLTLRSREPRTLVDGLVSNLADPDALEEMLRQYPVPSSRVYATLLPGRGPISTREDRASAALVELDVNQQRGLRLLAVLAAAAPLLGLLGTVTGMITTFDALDIGGGGDPSGLSSGIGEALLTTELGLIVAVPLLVLHAVFARDAQRHRARTEASAMRLLAAVEEREGSSS